MNLNDKINILTEKANLENKVRNYNLKCFHTKNEALKHSENIKSIKYKGFVAVNEDCIIGRNKTIYKSTEANNTDLYKLCKDKNYKEDEIESSIVEVKTDIQELIKDISMTNKQRESLITNLTFVKIATNEFNLIKESLTKLSNISTQNNFGNFLNDFSNDMKMENKNNIKKLYEDLLEEHEIQKLLTPDQLEEYKTVKIIQMFNKNGDLTTNKKEANLAWMIPIYENGAYKPECYIEKIVGKNCGNIPNSFATKYMLMLRPYNMDNKQTTHVVITVDDDKNIIEILGNANTKVNFGKYGKQLLSLFTETDYIDLGIDTSKLKDLSNLNLTELSEINSHAVREMLFDAKTKYHNLNIDDISFEEIDNINNSSFQNYLIYEKVNSHNFNIDEVSFEELDNIKVGDWQLVLYKKKMESPNLIIDNISLEEINNIKHIYFQEILLKKKMESPNLNIDNISLEEIFNIRHNHYNYYKQTLFDEKINSPNFNIDDISVEEISNIAEEYYQSKLIMEKIKSPNFNIDKFSLEEIDNMNGSVDVFLISAKVKSPNFNIDEVSFDEIFNMKKEFCQTVLIAEKIKSPNFNIDDVSLEDIDKIHSSSVRKYILGLKK